MKFSLDKGFIGLIKNSPSALKIAILLALGLLLILFSGIFNADTETSLTEEDRVAEMCSLIEGVGDCRVMLTYRGEESEEVYAALIICEGGESVRVREKITSLFCSLYGIGAHRVEIQELSKSE